MLTPIGAPIMANPEFDAEPDATRELLTLQRRSADALAGFQKMVEKAEPEFRPVVERFRALHDRHNAALTAMLIRHGQEPDAEGSFMGSLNKAMVSLRALFDEIDGSSMDSIRKGEEPVLEAFEDALAAPGLPPADALDLRELRDELTLLLLDTRQAGGI